MMNLFQNGGTKTQKQQLSKTFKQKSVHRLRIGGLEKP
jgi:hypothetical protein